MWFLKQLGVTFSADTLLVEGQLQPLPRWAAPSLLCVVKALV